MTEEQLRRFRHLVFKLDDMREYMNKEQKEYMKTAISLFLDVIQSND